ncbi:MAG: type IV toxin-antitoxin system AbiEi family antitoxin domain-containing protein [Planctomycetota bacterium]
MSSSSITPEETAIALLERVGIARAKDFEEQGLLPAHVSTLRERGIIERVGHGLYRLPGAELTEHHTLAIAASKSPSAVVCLLSALRFHDLTTQAAYEVWLAIARGARTPRLEYPPLTVIRMSETSFAHGVEEHNVEGVRVRVFSATKTVADCFKFRSRIGLEVAIEALQDFRASRNGSMDDLWNVAEACRVQRVIRPYMETLA